MRLEAEGREGGERGRGEREEREGGEREGRGGREREGGERGSGERGDRERGEEETLIILFISDPRTLHLACPDIETVLCIHVLIYFTFLNLPSPPLPSPPLPSPPRSSPLLPSLVYNISIFCLMFTGVVLWGNELHIRLKWSELSSYNLILVWWARREEGEDERRREEGRRGGGGRRKGREETEEGTQNLGSLQNRARRPLRTHHPIVPKAIEDSYLMLFASPSSLSSPFLFSPLFLFFCLFSSSLPLPLLFPLPLYLSSSCPLFLSSSSPIYYFSFSIIFYFKFVYFLLLKQDRRDCSGEALRSRELPILDTPKRPRRMMT